MVAGAWLLEYLREWALTLGGEAGGASRGNKREAGRAPRSA